MLTADEERARAIAAELDRANRERRDTERMVVEAAERARAELPEPSWPRRPALVLAGEGWHPGVVGIAASRLAERHFVPAVLIGIDARGPRSRARAAASLASTCWRALDACGEHLRRYGGHRAAAGLEIEAGRIDGVPRGLRRPRVAALGEQRPWSAPRRSTRSWAARAWGTTSPSSSSGWGPFGMGNPGVRLLVPSARVCDVRPMGEGDKARAVPARERRARAPSESRSASTGELAESRARRPGRRLGEARAERVERRGRAPRRAGRALPAMRPATRTRVRPHPGPTQEWRRRFDAERAGAARRVAARQAERPPTSEREVVDRRGGSGVAAVAALASSGEPVLALCADALRRRELVERAAAPARFGGGPVAIASGAAGRRRRSRRGRRGGRGRHAAWPSPTGPRWRGCPSMAARFEHVVVVDPPPFPHLERGVGRRPGRGFLHLAWGGGRARAGASRPRRRSGLAAPPWWRSTGPCATAGGRASKARARTERRFARSLHGPGRHPRSPEVAARRLRVLEELGAFGWELLRHRGALRVVSSEAKDLERLRVLRRLPRAVRGGQAIPKQAKTTELDERAPKGAASKDGRGSGTPRGQGERAEGAQATGGAAKARGAGRPRGPHPRRRRSRDRARRPPLDRARPGAGRRRARPARRPAGGDRRAQRRRRAADRRRGGRAGLRLRLRAPRRPAPQRRARTSSPTRSRWRRSAPACAWTPRRCARRSSTTRSRTRAPASSEVEERFGDVDRAARRRRHEAHRDHLPEPRREPGRELPQDDGRDGHGPPGHPDQARRPPPQHAHALGAAEAEADREGARDARDLRAARAPARDPRDQVGARGPLVPAPAPAQVRRDQEARLPAARRARALRHRRGRVPQRRARRRSASRPRSPAAPSTSTRSTRR